MNIRNHKNVTVPLPIAKSFWLYHGTCTIIQSSSLAHSGTEMLNINGHSLQLPWATHTFANTNQIAALPGVGTARVFGPEIYCKEHGQHGLSLSCITPSVLYNHIISYLVRLRYLDNAIYWLEKALSMIGFEQMKWHMDLRSANTLPDSINVKSRSDTISIMASFDLLYHWTNLLRNVTRKKHYDLNTCQQLATQPLQTHRVSVVRDKSMPVLPLLGCADGGVLLQQRPQNYRTVSCERDHMLCHYFPIQTDSFWVP